MYPSNADKIREVKIQLRAAEGRHAALKEVLNDIRALDGLTEQWYKVYEEACDVWADVSYYDHLLNKLRN